MTPQSSTSTRLDKYLWAIRIFKTRSAAAEACQLGKVKNEAGDVLKASRIVKPRDKYHIRKEGRLQLIEVIGIIEKRVAYELAQKYYADITPAEELERQKNVQAFYFSTGKRGNKQARPTKRDRRKMEDFKGNTMG